MVLPKPPVGNPVMLAWEPPQGEQPSAQWLLTFTDLVALLVCFFVLLFSMRELDVEAWDRVRGSFEGVFKIVPSDYAQAPDELPQAEAIVARRGSVLPYLQQVLRQKLAGVDGWDAWQGRLDRERDEVWYAWRAQAEVAPLANVLMGWKNEINLVASSMRRLPEALAAVDALRGRGVRVADKVVLDPGLADGVWLVVKGTQ